MTISAPISGFGLTRVTSNLQRNTFLGNIGSSLQKILKAQEQISTGFRIIQPSDDPVGANLTMELQVSLEKSEQYLFNIQHGSNTLNTVDSALGELGDIATLAKTIMLREVQDIDPEARRNSAEEVNGLLSRAVSLANSQYAERHVFGGFLTTENPFSVVGDAVLYRGDERQQVVTISQSVSLSVNMTGSQAFGALTTEVMGNVDLNPTLSAETKLAALNGGAGIANGSIQVGDGTATSTIDLTGAETLGDLLDVINNDAAGLVTATLTATGITLTPGSGSLFVREIGSGTTARDLGIAQQALTPGALAGSDLNPAMVPLTLLSQLNGGTGFTDLSTDITITNGTNSATFDFAAATTVEDILNTINNSGTFVEARINSSGNGIDIISKLNGARLSITDAAGGQTASELGILLSFDRMKLADMNNGDGVSAIDGDDIRVTLSDGSTLDIDISSATTVQDVLNLINNDPENGSGFLTASVVAGQDRIQLVDSSGGAGAFEVTRINGSFAADNLGIRTTGTAGTLTGSDLSPTGVETDSLFTALIALRNALRNDDTHGIERAGAMMDVASARLLNTRAEVGSRVARLEMTTNRLLDEAVRIENMLTETRGIDLTEAILDLQNQQTLFQASLATAALISRTSLLDFL